MGRLCVNQYDEGVDLSLEGPTAPLCIAHWAHTQEQVLIALGIWAALLLTAGVWTFASRRQRRRLRVDEIGFSLKWRRWARTSRAAALLNRPVQLATSLGIFAFMINRCNSYEVSVVGYVCMSVLYVVALVDAGVRFLAARYKVLHCFAPMTILECLMIAAHCQVGFGSTKLINGAPTRSWLDFSIMRPIFILRSYLEMEKHLPRASRGWMILRLAIKVLLLIMFGAATMFFLETLGEMPFFTQNGFAHLYACDSGVVTRDGNECSTETWSIMFSFYFTVVTLGTVGYGDNSPKTVLSRLLAIMFIVMGVILFSMEIENLINLYKSRQIGNPPFQPKPEARHVVVMGNPSFSQLSSILRELFHEDHVTSTDHESGRLHAVVLGERKSKFTKGLVAKLEADPIFAANVTYVAGTATKPEDLERALAKRAEAVFVFPDKLSDDPANEDALNIMRVLATKRYCGPDVRCLVMVLRAENARHMLAAGVNRDDVICENVIKMGTLAQSAVSHGMSTLLANLAASLSVDRSVEDDSANTSEAPAEAVSLRGAFVDKTTQSDLLLSRVFEKPAASSRRRHWLKEYYHGAAKEMYLIRISKKYAGLTFSEAAGRIFTETEGNVVLIAVEVIFSNTKDELGAPRASDSRVLLNPGSSLIMAEWMQCYVIADDLTHVFEHHICPDEVTQEELLQGSAGGALFDGVADTFIEPTEDDSGGEDSGRDSFRSVTAYAPMTTPTGTRRLDETHTEPSHPTLREQRQRRSVATIGRGTENVVLDRSLRSVALNFAVEGPSGGDPMGLRFGGIRENETSIHVARNYHHYTDERRMSNSLTSLDGVSTQMLEPPPLDVLLHPRHIVVCSFLGDESLASLQWLILPLRGVYANGGHPPITILDAAEPTPAVVASLTSFSDVYYVRGSPLVHADLQRAGAKAASAVIVLGKRTKDELMKSSSDDIETSIIDSQAIFCTMLIELKMDFTKIFTITELSDESNSKFLGTSFQLHQWVPPGQEDTTGSSGLNEPDESESALSWWEYLLLNDIPQQKSEKAIFGLPLYMSGRLLHPELCENMLVQTFYNPSIHKIIRQLVGGPRCTGVVRSFAIPKTLRTGATYGDLFHTFASSSFAGICLGVYRISTQTVRAGKQPVQLPIVLSTPEPDLPIVSSDRLFVLIGVHTLSRAAHCIQRAYRNWRKGRFPPAQVSQTGASATPATAGAGGPYGAFASVRKPSFYDPRSRISKYLAPQSSRFEVLNVPKTQRRSLIAQESNSSFRSYYV